MTIQPCLIDLSARAKFQLSGPDRDRYLNGQVSNKVSLATAERAIEACVCNVKGKLDGVVFITRAADAETLLIDAPAELRESLFARLDRYLIADDCELTDVTDDFGLIHAIGERPDLPGAAWRSANRFGPVGHDLWITPDSRRSLMKSAGATWRPTETAADIEEIRIRHGIPKWGAELSPDVLPAEAGLDLRAIDFHKGCYLGQEVISRIKSVGRVNRSLGLLSPINHEEGISISSGDLLYPETSATTEESAIKPAGTVTSVSTGGKWAMAYLRRDWTTPETRLVTRPTDAKVKVGILEVRTFESAED